MKNTKEKKTMVTVLGAIPEFDKRCKTKVTTMGNITEVLTMQKNIGGSPCRKLDKDHYFDTRTGDVFEYEHFKSRADSVESVRQTLVKVRALVNCNVVEPQNVRWVTLTYGENMMDTERLYRDFKAFWKRFCRWNDAQGLPRPEYITVQEPQGRGAWHVHAFFIWPVKAPFIPNEKMAELWSQGFTKTKACDNCDNVGAYFSAYLADMPLDEVQKLPDAEQDKIFTAHLGAEDKTFTDDAGTTLTKPFIKGGRLFLYPPGMNIVRTSRGVKRPEVEYMSKEMATKKVSAATETFSRAYAICDKRGETLNVISKAYYNSKRKK